MTQPPWGAPGGGPDDSSQSLPDPPNPYAQQSPYVQPPTPYTPPPQPGPRKGLSITAFVLGLIGCIPLVSVAAVIVGIVALLKKQALRGLAIAGIALGAMWIVASILFFTSGAAADFARGFQEAMEEGLGESQVDRDSSGQVTESQTASSQALRLGDCFNDDAAIDVSDETIESLTLEIVPCSGPHMFEVFHVEEMEGDGSPARTPWSRERTRPASRPSSRSSGSAMPTRSSGSSTTSRRSSPGEPSATGPSSAP